MLLPMSTDTTVESVFIVDRQRVTIVVGPAKLTRDVDLTY